MRLITVTLLVSLLQACTNGPQPITYGSDGCHFCKMTIVDERFAAEIVTDKGKIYKFDAIECMINHSNNESLFGADGYNFWITDLNQPRVLINARYSYFLRAKALPSPMGMYLSGYNDQRSALIKHNEIGGKIYSWKELKESFDVLPELSFSQ